LKLSLADLVVAAAAAEVGVGQPVALPTNTTEFGL